MHAQRAIVYQDQAQNGTFDLPFRIGLKISRHYIIIDGMVEHHTIRLTCMLAVNEALLYDHLYGIRMRQAIVCNQRNVHFILLKSQPYNVLYDYNKQHFHL